MDNVIPNRYRQRTMTRTLQDIIRAYDASATTDRAVTIPSAWYTDPRIHALERKAVFGSSWQWVGRLEQLREIGRYVTASVAGEPIVAVRDRKSRLQAFHNVCRHHAAAVCSLPEGKASALRCPYHGWTYGLDGRLEGVPQFESARDFDKSEFGLVPVRVDTWADFVFVNIDGAAPPLTEFARPLIERVAAFDLDKLRFAERRSYELACNWKVYVDNYLDGGYHVPFIHKALGSVLDNAGYTIENEDRVCVQTSPIRPDRGDAETASVRAGDTALYVWLYPNFMINCYEGVMDVNLVLPLALDRTLVVFDFFFADGGSIEDREREISIKVAERIQHEDMDICESVQRGLSSRAYDVGRLSPRREAGEHLFHRLLYNDLNAALDGS